MGLRVSVALCTRNGGEFLRSQLESILSQDHLPDEVVISDDASTDNTTSLIEEFARIAPPSMRVRVHANAVALGVRDNFSQALRHCTGDIVLLSDQDDVWRSDRVRRTVAEFAHRQELQLMFSDARLIDDAGRVLPHTLFESLEVTPRDKRRIRLGDAFAVLLRRNLATGATTALRNDLIQRALPIPSPWLHDEWLAIIASSLGAVAIVDKPLIDYRQHSSNVIGVASPTMRRKIARVFEIRGDRNELLRLRAAELVTKLKALGIPSISDTLALAEQKLEFEASRTVLPNPRIRRLRPVLNVARFHLYKQFSSQGLKDIIRDLLQPHR